MQDRTEFDGPEFRGAHSPGLLPSVKLGLFFWCLKGVRTIIRVNHTADAPYLTMSKDTIRDTGLDFDSLGCLVFLLSKPDDWEIRPEVLAKERKIGRAAMYRNLRKLIESGYVIRKDIRIREEHGHFKQVSIYNVYESKGDASYDKVPF